MLDKKDDLIGIFGYGVTGRAVAEWCDLNGKKKIIFDDNLEECEPFAEKTVSKCTLIVRSPSFFDDNRWIVFAKSCGIECVTELDLAAKFWKGKIIAVTGTDGKTTTTEFLSHALKCVDHNAVAVGNNGQSLLRYLDEPINEPDSFAVIEVSSFQSNALSKLRPDYVIWTNFAQDHINIHGTLDNYFAAKYKLVRLCHQPNENHIFVGESVNRYAEKIGNFNLTDYVHTEISHLPEKSALNISVQHENYALIEALWRSLNFPFDVLEEAALSFSLPEHRLQRIFSIEKNEGYVDFWNDSKATNFHSFRAALRSFDKKVILIAGGRSKGEDLEQYVTEICQKASSVLLMGETGEQIYQKILQKKCKKVFNLVRFYGMDRKDAEKIVSKIVNDAFYVALPGDVVLLSPGFASFDMFTCFEERGDLYKQCVLKLKIESDLLNEKRDKSLS